MTTVDFFVILSSIATVVYTIVTISTLMEIKTQRETTYRPELIIDERYFNIFSSDKGKGLFPNEFSYNGKSEDYVEPPFSFYWLKLTIHNIGLASAKNVQVEFSHDLLTTISGINRRNQEMNNERGVDVRIQNGFIYFQAQTDSPANSSATSVRNSTNSTINHILPINIPNNEGAELPIPPHYLELYAVMVYNSWQETTGKKSFAELSFKLSLNYQDIGNKTHIKNFQITLSFYQGSERESTHRLTINEIRNSTMNR